MLFAVKCPVFGACIALYGVFRCSCLFLVVSRCTDRTYPRYKIELSLSSLPLSSKSQPICLDPLVIPHRWEEHRAASMSGAEEAELLQLVALAKRPRVDLAARPPGALNAVVVAAEADEVAELSDLAQVVFLGGLRQERKHEHRSWQPCERARAAKAQKRLAAAIETAEGKTLAAEAKLGIVGCLVPTVAKVLAIPKSEAVADDVQTVQMRTQVKLACCGKIRGASSGGMHARQVCAAHVTAMVGHKLQVKSACDMFMPTSVPAAYDARVVERNIVNLSFMWGESSQRVRALTQVLAHGTRRESLASVSVQIMVATGQMMQWQVSSTGAPRCVRSEPWLVRSKQLEGQSTDYILEGILQALPVNLLDIDTMNQVCRRNDATILTFSCDRASTNITSVSWLMYHMAKSLHPQLLPHLEFCAAHGIAIVKTRAPPMKSLVAGSFSLLRFLRFHRNVSALGDRVAKYVSDNLDIRVSAMPPEHEQRIRDIIAALYGEPDDEEYLYI